MVQNRDSTNNFAEGDVFNVSGRFLKGDNHLHSRGTHALSIGRKALLNRLLNADAGVLFNEPRVFRVPFQVLRKLVYVHPLWLGTFTNLKMGCWQSRSFFYLYANPAGASETQQTWQQGLLGDLETGSSRCLISPWIKQTLLNRSILFNSSIARVVLLDANPIIIAESLDQFSEIFNRHLAGCYHQKTGVFQFQFSHLPKWVINIYLDKLQ